MSPEDKAARRELIRERANPTRADAPNGTFWLTRNRTNGELNAKVDVWVVKPDAVRFKDGDVHWIGLLEPGGETGHFGRWTNGTAHAHAGNGVPDTDRECLKVERPRRELPPAEIVEDLEPEIEIVPDEESSP